tara:strand:- start:867 stop:1466 length:600 start_codon:yes stop_codon:yes gene_type:complete
MDSAKPDATPWQPEEGETVLCEIAASQPTQRRLQFWARCHLVISLLIVGGFGVFSLHRLWVFMETAGWQILSDLQLYPIILLESGFRALFGVLAALGISVALIWWRRGLFERGLLERYVFTDRRVLGIGTERSISAQIRVDDIRAAILFKSARPKGFYLARTDDPDEKHGLWIIYVEDSDAVLDFLKTTYGIAVETAAR